MSGARQEDALFSIELVVIEKYRFIIRVKQLLVASIEKQNSKDDVEYKEKIVMDHSYYEMHLYKV